MNLGSTVMKRLLTLLNSPPAPDGCVIECERVPPVLVKEVLLLLLLQCFAALVLPQHVKSETHHGMSLRTPSSPPPCSISVCCGCHQLQSPPRVLLPLQDAATYLAAGGNPRQCTHETTEGQYIHTRALTPTDQLWRSQARSEDAALSGACVRFSKLHTWLHEVEREGQRQLPTANATEYQTLYSLHYKVTGAHGDGCRCGG